MRRKDRELSDREELVVIFDAADSCRLAFAVADEPYIVTLNYGYEWDGRLPILYFHCAREGRKLDMMRANPRVCFELDVDHRLTPGDSPCDWGMKYASIVGYGRLGEITDDAERRSAMLALLRHYGWQGETEFRGGIIENTLMLRLVVDEMSGKRKA